MAAKKTAEPEPMPAGMAVERIAVVDLHEDPANVRKHPDRNIHGIKASLVRFGQQRPLLIDGKNIVRAGNGTLRAARELGWEYVDCVRTELVGSEATAYSVADNRLAETSCWSDDLALTLKSLQAEDFDLGDIGFTDEEVEALFGLPATEGVTVDDPQGEWQGMPEYEHDDLTSQFKAIVHFRNEEDLKAFEKLVGQKIPRDRWAIWYPITEIGHYADKQYATDSSDNNAENDET